MAVRELFQEHSPYRLFREKILPVLGAARSQLADLYCQDNGRPAIEPVIMAGTVLLQFMEKVPDRKAVSHLKLHLGWKYALDLELNADSFHASSLVVFRQRLVDTPTERLVFDSVLKALQAEGLVKKGSNQRLDSTHVLGCVARMSRLEVVRESLRLCLQDLDKQKLESRPANWQLLMERYCESEVDYRQLTQPAKRVAKLKQAGEAALQLLQWLEQLPAEVAQRKSCQVLKRVVEEQFEGGDGELEVRKTEVPGGVKNPHDAEAQWAAKDPAGKSQWVGYKAQVMETVPPDGKTREKRQPTEQFITEITTTEAISSDLEGMHQVLKAHSEHGWDKPSQLYADTAYVSGEELALAQQEGRELVGPARSSPPRKNMLPSEQFDVDVANRKAVCPAGKINSKCGLIHDSSQDRVYYRFEWGKQCEGCPLQSKCAGKTGRRTLTVGIHHEELQTRRREMQTESFQPRMHQRNAIEGTVSELVRGYGLRKTRYKGLAKTRMGNYFIGAACNLNRWARLVSWQTENAA